MLSLRRGREVFVRHLHFVGPGLVSSVAYIDPGNWATDLAAGADFGYKLLFVVLLAGLAAVVLQLLAVRLGAVTSQSLPAQTRLLFLRLESRYPRYRVLLRICLYSLYALAEIAIVGTDLAELLGSAIALHLLFPRLPLFAGVLITAADILIVLIFFRSDNGRQGMLLFEIVIVSLVVAVFVSFMILLKLVKPEWKEVFFGLVPSATLVQPSALYVAIGIIGATVMPHALFLGSSLASVDRLNMVPRPPTLRTRKSFRMPKMFSWPFPGFSRASPRSTSTRRQQDEDIGTSTCLELGVLPTRTSVDGDRDSIQPAPLPKTQRRGSDFEDKILGCDGDEMSASATTTPRLGAGLGESSDALTKDFEDATREYEADLMAFDRIRWVDLHVLHATIDTSLSLLGFALTINAAILTLAGAAYFYGDTGSASNDASLEGAFQLIKSYIGNAAAIIFALALLCAGQSASITATLAGQVVSEGFINWKTSPFVRRLVTRLIGVIPAATVAAAVGNQGLNTMLVASQVLLSIVLPTVIFPLVYLCSRKDIMTVDGPEVEGEVTTAVAVAGAGEVAVTEENGEFDRSEPSSRIGNSVEAQEAHEAQANQSYPPRRVDGATSLSRRSGQVLPRPISPNLRDLTPSVSFSDVLPQALAIPLDPPTRPTSEPSQRSFRSRGDANAPAVPPTHENTSTTSTSTSTATALARVSTPNPALASAPAQTRRRTQRRQKSYVSPWWWTSLGYLLFAVVCLANGYVIVQLILGNG